MNIFITGAESTGKSTLAKQLSGYFSVPLVPEFAREYISNLDREYNQTDLEVIGKHQLSQIKDKQGNKLVFFDTGLIITLVWYELKYGLVPKWLEMAIPEYAQGKYIICDTDIPWVEDPVRENPERREELNLLYQARIEGYGFECIPIKGNKNIRLRNSIEIVEHWLPYLRNK